MWDSVEFKVRAAASELTVPSKRDAGYVILVLPGDWLLASLASLKVLGKFSLAVRPRF